ncbi:LADA_0E15060g1_1 [Lachancea dasiensis]|uniref:LADA_0E15060g1_1 n=1 Tax=Lachancea dasiensis TaxID=1072105 RepID=A0A1G4JG98_9SACH|nr:LADA_0E15060g1_1 [Lachancea dasiensis]
MQSEPHVVIIGGSFAGIKAAEIILGLGKPVRLSLISASSHAYFNVAAPRVLVEPDLAEKLYFAVEDKLRNLDSQNSTFIHGHVQKVDCDGNSVVYRDNKSGAEKALAYDYLVVASGTKSPSAAFKLQGDHKETMEAALNLHDKIKKSKEILIIGGGATAVEIAGELGHTYGKEKDLAIYSGANAPLASWLPRVSEAAERQLQNLNVKVVNNVRSRSIVEVEGKFRVDFDDGSSRTVDLAIPAYGVVPNGEFLDSALLDKQGYLQTDEFLVARDHPNVFGLGDIVSGRPCTLIDVDQVQQTTFKATVDTLIFGGNGKRKPMKKGPELGLVPISRAGGVGVVFGWRVPSFFVKFMKSKDFMIPRGAEAFT